MEQLLLWFHRGFELVTWGAWDRDRLVAQYNCRLLRLEVPGLREPALVGMGLNMAVDPAYRGRGLLDTVAGPVHEMITARGCVAGVGFSSTGGLAVTRRSSSYSYQVLGPMTSLAAVLSHRRYPEPLERLVRESDVLVENDRPGTLLSWARGTTARKPVRRRALGLPIGRR